MDLKKQIQELKKSKEPMRIKVLKTESHNTVTFVALEPDVEDYNGDIATRDEIIKAAHNFMINLQEKVVNINHEEWTDIDKQDAQFVESYILPVDIEFDDWVISEWSWLVAIKFNDDLFWKIQSWDIVGISVEGSYFKDLIV